MNYLSVSQTAEKWGISTRRIQILCGEGRIPGAMRIGAFWAIPEDAAKPTDARIKNGKYIKVNESGTTVVVVTHNREIVNAMQKRVITMKKEIGRASCRERV